MNERIMECAEQARLHAQKIYPEVKDIKGWGQVYHEKFTELIVRECGRVYIQNQQDGVMTLTQDLLQHFGVEE